MSDDVFPDLLGITWGVKKTPQWATKILSMASGREMRGSFQSYPRWKFTLKYEFLREKNNLGEFATLCGFFNQRGGSFESFLFRDPEDYKVLDQVLGISDGVQAEYRFVRALGGFVEPVLAPEDMWLYYDRGAALGRWYVVNHSRTNQFVRTEDFSNGSWDKLGLTVVINSANAPDGVADADRLVEDSGTSAHRVYQTCTAPGGADKKHCVSWYVKPNGRTSVLMDSAWAGATTGAVEFLLSGAGSVISMQSQALAAGVRQLSNGWYRIWTIYRPTSAAAQNQYLYLKATQGGSATYAGNGSSGVYAAWTQCEKVDETAPDEPTEYIPSVGAAPTTVAAAFTLSDYGYFTLSPVPPDNVDISWSGTFYFRCRFTHDAAEFERFMYQLYNANKIEFISIK